MFQNKKIILAVTGSAAIYKACELAGMLVKQQAQVDVIMTDAATQLIQPLLFQSLTQRPVRSVMFERQSLDRGGMPHLSITCSADLMVIAPATAHCIGKIAAGIADDLVTTAVLSFNKQIIVAPAMNTVMWENPFVQRNVKILKDTGFHIIGPIAGHLACGTSGMGRMIEPEHIIALIKQLLGSHGA